MAASPLPTQAVVNTRHALNIVAQLLAQGVKEAVISPGSRNTPLVFALDAWAKKGRLKLHVVLDERVAGFVALGAARISGKPVVLSCTSGSAGAHYLPALMEAQRSKLCLIALTADRPEELHQRGAPQTIDQQSLFAPYVHETLRLGAPSPGVDLDRETTQSVQRAIASARAAQSPLHINAALREPLWSTDCEALLLSPPPTRELHIFEAEAQPSSAGLESLRSIDGRGLIYVGPIDAGALSNDARNELTQALLDTSARLDWPLAADAVSPLRQAGLPVIQHADVLLRNDQFYHQDVLDYVVVVGPWPTSKPFGQWLERNPNLTLISLPGAVGPIDPWHRVDRTVCGALIPCIQALGSHSTAASTQRDRAQSLDLAVDAALQSFCEAHPLFEGTVARTVLATATQPLSLHIASSMPIRDVDTYSAGAQPGVTLCASRGVNGIDGNISTALGAALSSNTPALLLIGDIAFRHDVGGLIHAANTEAALTVIVVDNGGGGIFRHLAVAASGDRFDPYFITPQTTRIADLANGTGARVHTLADARGLPDLLARCIPQRGVDVLCLSVPGELQVPWRQQAVKLALHAAAQAEHAGSNGNASQANEQVPS